MPIKYRRFPWLTASIVALALVCWISPTAVQDALIYDRAAILRGEIWRLWSGHWVHFSATHLGWNILVVGLTGVWIEGAGFSGGRSLLVFAPPCISLALLIGCPLLARYGGLSGVATAGAVFASLSQWRRDPAHSVLWCAALALIGTKIGWEFASGNSVFANFNGGQVRASPSSHLAGAGAAIAMWLAGASQRNFGSGT